MLISVITVTYNAATLLERTIQSVKREKETLQGIQYIVIDGASTDHTPEVIERYRDTIDLLISEPDDGIYDAMNKGLHVAEGMYLCFLNAGDTFHTSGQLATIFEELRLSKVPPEWPGVIYGQTDIVDAEGLFLYERTPRAPEQLTPKSFLGGMTVCHQSFYPLRSLAEDYDDRHYRYSADYDWCLKILIKSSRNYYTHRTLTDYLSEGATTRHRIDSLRERLRIMRKHFGTLPTLGMHVFFLLRLPFKPLLRRLPKRGDHA